MAGPRLDKRQLEEVIFFGALGLGLSMGYGFLAYAVFAQVEGALHYFILLLLFREDLDALGEGGDRASAALRGV